MDFKEIGIYTRNWDDSTQNRDYWTALVNAALNLRVPLAMELVISIGRSGCRWEDSIRIYLKEKGVNMRNWNDLAQIREYNASL